MVFSPRKFMRIAVTGGAGFIGSHVAKLLCDSNHQVTIIDNLSTGFEKLLDPRAHFVKLDLANSSELVSVLAGHEVVIHMASFIEVGESVKKPVEFAENNIVNAVKLLEAMRQAEVKKIIFSSSACVYGTPKRLPILEEDPLGIQSNPYGATKIAVESFCAVYHKIHGFDCIILRYFNPYGPNELHQPETHVIPNFIKAALTKTPIPLYWNGEQIRDFIYITDLAKAHTSVLDLKGLHYFNIGTQTGIKVKDVLDSIFKIVGFKVKINDLGTRPGDTQANFASFEKIHKAIGWKPEVSLENGLKQTIDYYRENLATKSS